MPRTAGALDHETPMLRLSITDALGLKALMLKRSVDSVLGLVVPMSKVVANEALIGNGGQKVEASSENATKVRPPHLLQVRQTRRRIAEIRSQFVPNFDNISHWD